MRYGDLLKYDHGGEGFEADLMRGRLETSLLIGNDQFVEFQFEGRVLLTDLGTAGPFGATFGLGDTDESDEGTAVVEWFGALTKHTWLRRAAEDVYMALKVPSENPLFLFRAFEWLQKGLDVSWGDLGATVDIHQTNLKRLKKEANSQVSAARHAVPSGRKLHFEDKVAGSWAHGALHAIAYARTVVDSDYKRGLEAEGNPYPLDEPQ